MMSTHHLQPTPVGIEFRIVTSFDDVASEFREHPYELCLESCTACQVIYLTENELDNLIGLAIKVRGEFRSRKSGV